jgi:hypothetical protein
MVPAAVALAVAAARPEMLALAPPKELPAEQIAGLYGLLGDMIRDNYALSKRIAALEASIGKWARQADDTVRAAMLARAEAEGLRNLLREAAKLADGVELFDVDGEADEG